MAAAAEEDIDVDMEELRLRLLASGLEERHARLLVAAVDASSQILEDLKSGTNALLKMALSCVGLLAVLCGALVSGWILIAGVIISLAAAISIWWDEYHLKWAEAVQADVRAVLELTGNDDLLPLKRLVDSQEYELRRNLHLFVFDCS